MTNDENIAEAGKTPLYCRVLVLDDHPIVLRGIENVVLEGENVACTALTSLPAASGCERYDLCILDLGLCGAHPGAAIDRLRLMWPGCRVLVYTMHEEPWMAAELEELGVEGIVSKHSPLDELRHAIAELRKGGTYCDPVFTRLKAAPVRLTSREKEVLALMLDGRNGPEIASALNISIDTVKTHRRSLMSKFAVKTSAGLVSKAGGTDLLKPDVFEGVS